MTLRTSPRFASGWERVGPTRSANHPPPHTGAKLLRRDASSAGRSADPLERVLLSGFFCQATSAGGGAHHLALLGRAVPPILLLLEGKGKGSHAYDSMAIRKLRPSSHARIFCALRISIIPAGYLVFGLLTGVLVDGFLVDSGVLRDGVERLRGIIRAGCGKYPRCGRRFGGASGDGLSGCIS